jgi:glycerol 3-phosphatase-2
VSTLADGYDLFIFDLDGVVYVGADPVPNAVDALNRLHANGSAVAYATNNASRSAEEVAALLRRLGITAAADEVVTSAQASAAALAERFPAGSRILVVGNDALGAELGAVGLRPVATADEDPVAVVQGYGPHIGWTQLAEGCVAIRGGAFWLATNTDRTLPSARGPLPGNGALVAALATAVDREPDLVVGKPQPTLFRTAAKNRPGSRALVVGDRLDTDIEGGNRAGLDTLCVLTGVTRPADLLVAAPIHRPTHIAADLTGLFASTVDAPQWTVERTGDGYLDLTAAAAGGTDAVQALRALCAETWRQPGEPRAADQTAVEALRTLGIPAVTTTSEASAGRRR